MQISGIKPNDIVHVDHGGRRFFALVRSREDRALRIKPLAPGVSYRSCTSHQVIGHWRASKATAGKPEMIP